MKPRWSYALILLGVVGVAASCGGGSSEPTQPGGNSGTTGKPWPGRIIVTGSGSASDQVTLGTGEVTSIPVDSWLQSRGAYWSGGQSGAKVLMVYSSLRAFFHDPTSFAKAAPDFSPLDSQGSLSSLHSAEISRDGVYFAACWNGNGTTSLGLFRVGGDYVGRIASPPSDACLRFAWLSNQRLVYDNGTGVTITDGDASRDIRHPYPNLPAGMTLHGSQFAVDPAGTRIIWAASIAPPSDAPNARLVVLVVANIDGSSPRQLTDYTEAAKRGAYPLWDSSATWSPDGQYIAFHRTTSSGDYYHVPGGNEWVGTCTPIIVLPAGSSGVVIDTLDVAAPVDDSMLYTVPSTGKLLSTCSAPLWTE
jgi:hypothetical protein